MEPFDPGMFPFRARVVPVSEDDSDDAGPIEVPGTPGTLLSCRVRQKLALRDAVGGDARESATVRYDVAFPADPGARLNDRLEVVTPALSLRFLGPAQARDADGVLWVAACESYT